MLVLAYSFIALGAYLLGSIPTGFLVARMRGVDIRTVGSKNMGATNVFRVLGKGPGIVVLLVDAMKGWAAIALTRYEIHSHFADAGGPNEAIAPIVAGLFAILGHIFTCWLKFKGGKGIATSAGVMVALVPWALLVSLLLWLVAFVTTRYVSVASIAAAAVLPVATWFTTHDAMLTGVTFLVAALAIYKHKTNIQRLMNGTENRFHFKKKDLAT
ncbi:MAG: glycerol-3-phosphate 1-O-acyltransferase PlsY [Verrucomicrobiota bacterium]